MSYHRRTHHVSSCIMEQAFQDFTPIGSLYSLISKRVARQLVLAIRSHEQPRALLEAITSVLTEFDLLEKVNAIDLLYLVASTRATGKCAPKLDYKSGALPAWGKEHDYDHIRHCPPFHAVPDPAYLDDSWSSTKSPKSLTGQYMQDTLDTYARRVDVHVAPSDTLDYHERDHLSVPHEVTFEMTDGTVDCISFECTIPGRYSKWTAPLEVNHVSVPFIFVEAPCEGVKHPHVVVNQGEYVSSHGLPKVLEEQLQAFIASSDKEDGCTFFQRFLEACSPTSRVRHILAYMPSLDVPSGK